MLELNREKKENKIEIVSLKKIKRFHYKKVSNSNDLFFF